MATHTGPMIPESTLSDNDRVEYVSGGWNSISIVGTSFPGSPYNGQMYYRSDLGMQFRYDGDRSKWLGELEKAQYVDAGPVADAYVGPDSSVTSGSGVGFLIPYNVTVVGYSWTRSGQKAATAYVRRNGTDVISHSMGADDYGATTGLDGNFDASGIMTLYFDHTVALQNSTEIVGAIYYRRVAT